jgi:hypothetical protein
VQWKAVSWYSDDTNTSAAKKFTCDTLTVAARAAALEVGPSRAHDLGNLSGMPRSVHVETRQVLAGLGVNDAKATVKDVGTGPAVQVFAASRGRHAAELLRTDRHKDVLLLESRKESVPLRDGSPWSSAYRSRSCFGVMSASATRSCSMVVRVMLGVLSLGALTAWTH